MYSVAKPLDPRLSSPHAGKLTNMGSWCRDRCISVPALHIVPSCQALPNQRLLLVQSWSSSDDPRTRLLDPQNSRSRDDQAETEPSAPSIRGRNTPRGFHDTIGAWHARSGVRPPPEPLAQGAARVGVPHAVALGLLAPGTSRFLRPLPRGSLGPLRHLHAPPRTDPPLFFFGRGG